MRERFFKTHGNGNDFIIFVANHYQITQSNQNYYASISRKAAERYRHVGCDQVIFFSLGFPQGLLEFPPESSNIISYCKRNNFYRFVNNQQSLLQLTANNNRLLGAELFIFNANGTRASACGNATRCAAFLLYRLSCNRIKNSSLKVGERQLEYSIVARDGRVADISLEAVNNQGKSGINTLYGEVLVKLGQAKWSKLPPQSLLKAESIPCYYVDVGNEHIILDISNLVNKKEIFLEKNIFNPIVAKIAPLYPQGINISVAYHEFAAVDISSNPGALSTQINIRTYERGVGETQMCGTACAAAFAVMHEEARHIPFIPFTQAEELDTIKNITLNPSNSVLVKAEGGTLRFAFLNADRAATRGNNLVSEGDIGSNGQILMQGPAEISCYGEFFG